MRERVLPLSYAVLQLFLTEEEADVDQMMEALRQRYSFHRQFTVAAVTEILMAAEANGLLAETRIWLEESDRLRIWYSATPTGRDMIRRYIEQ